jgi:hypothetical protein
MPASRIVFWGALAFAVVAGIVLRVWILAGPLGALESDEAVSGLIARHMLDGEVAALYWLTPYGGTLEPAVAAAVFAVFGSSVLALKLTTLGIFAAAAVLTWQVGLRTVGPRAALVGTALFWVFPAYLVWWTTKARAYYGMGVLLGLVVLLLVLRLRERDSRRDAAGLGLALGLGWWTTPAIVMIAVPALAWLLVRRRSAFGLTSIAVALPGLLVGIAPWVAWNARNGWLSLDFTPVAAEQSTLVERLGHLFEHVLPTWFGMRVPFSLEWIAGPAIGWTILAVALGALVVGLVRRPPELEPLLAVAVAFPLLHALSAYTYYFAEPRYVVYVGPVIALLLGRALTAPPAAAVGIVCAVALSTIALVRMEDDRLFQPDAAEGRPAGSLEPVIDLLEREGERYVLADYWIAYRLTFESAERVIATSTGFVRYQPHDRLVRASAEPARVFGAESRVEPRLRRRLLASGYRRHQAGDWIVYVHRR